MSATTCTSSPVLVNLTVPLTWLPDFGSSVAVALVWAEVTAANALIRAIERSVVFIPKLRTIGAEIKLNRAGGARGRRRHRPYDRAGTASAFDVRSPGPSRSRRKRSPPDRPILSR